MAGDSNRAKKNYSRYALASREVLFNILLKKKIRTRQVLIIWTEEDEKRIIYFLL